MYTPVKTEMTHQKNSYRREYLAEIPTIYETRIPCIRCAQALNTLRTKAARKKMKG